MRSTLEIIIAVKDCEDVTEQELKYALLAMSAMNHFAEEDLRALTDAVQVGNPQVIKLRTGFASDGQSRRLDLSMKMPVDEYLGPGNIPGTPEYNQRMEFSKSLYKQIFGEDL